MWKVNKISPWFITVELPAYEITEFRFDSQELSWNWYLKRYVYTPCYDYLYREEISDGLIKFGIGWSSYLLYHYYDRFDAESIKILDECDKLEVNLSALYQVQLNDVNSLLKFRRGLFQVYTGYGKTEIIVQLMHHLSEVLGLNVLVVCPNGTALNTLWDRYKKRFNEELPYFDWDDNLNLINVNGYPKSSLYNQTPDSYWNSVDVILADEVEDCLTDKSIEMYEKCINYKRIYGFSATADKVSGDRVSLYEKNAEVIQRNKCLIDYFGFASVFKLPSDFIINNVDIKTTLFQNVKTSLDASSEVNEIMYTMFTDDKFCEGLMKIIQKEPGIYIPMTRLQVIDYWIEHYFNKPDFVCVNICGRGYELYIGGKYIESVSFDELNELLGDGTVNVLVGTKSSIAAMDLPNLNKVLLMFSKLAGMVIQAIGRVTRSNEFTIFNLIPYENVMMYSRDLAARKSLISQYYKNCKINNYERLESEYGI